MPIRSFIISCILVLLGSTQAAQPMTYFIDPANGDDTNSGITQDHAWKTLNWLNKQSLGPGDSVTVAPGVLQGSLAPKAIGTKSRPVVIQFVSGWHEFRASGAIALPYFVSNSADAPLEPRPIGILVKNAQHLKIVGAKGCEIWFGDRMTQLVNDHSEDVTYEGLNFDLVRPTVSEFRVTAVGPDSADIQVAEGSTYTVKEGRFAWTGDLGPGWTMVQEADPATGKCWRRGQWDPFSSANAKILGRDKLRLTYKSGNLGMIAGHQFQFRNVIRDTTSGLNSRCKDIVFRDCNFYSLPGMAIVSQFTENITFQRVNVIPRPGTIRTCPAWADCFHFSGCRGKVLVDSCQFSGAQDDPINVHGTYLRLIEKVGSNQVIVRFMHPQTYGFAAFQPGDNIEFVSHTSLRPYSSAVVTAIQRKTDTDWLLSLDRDIPEFAPNDVVDNNSWYPDLTIRNCTVTMDSCRGFLISTRGKVLVTGNTFSNTSMSAILIADDANSWFESGCVRDVTIRGNRFLDCGDPVISINPENRDAKPDEPVHEGIRILDNVFERGGISARSVKGLLIRSNTFRTNPAPIHIESCSKSTIAGNRAQALTGT